MSQDHPALSKCITKWVVGTLSSNDAATVNLASLFTNGRVSGFQIFNTHASGDLSWTGEGVTAEVDGANGGLIEFGEDSGFVPSGDATISLIREAGIAVTYKVMVVGR